MIFQDSALSLDQDFISYGFGDWIAFSARPENSGTYPFVSTVRYKIAVPEIIVLRNYDRLPIREVKYSRQTVFDAFARTCAYCGEIFDVKNLTIDHVIPRSKGGKTTFVNVVASCRSCNFHKADRTPEEAGMKLLLKPRKPRWISPLNKVGKFRRPSWERFMSNVDVDIGENI